MKTQLYSAAHAAALKEKNKKWNLVFVLICVLTLGAVVFCALRRSTLNAARMELCATAAMTLGGWIAIAVEDCVLRANRVLREHEERILSSDEPVRELHGAVTLEKRGVRIARSIDVRGLRVQTAEGTERLLVNNAFAETLAREAAQGELTLRAVEGFVTEVER